MARSCTSSRYPAHWLASCILACVHPAPSLPAIDPDTLISTRGAVEVHSREALIVYPPVDVDNWQVPARLPPSAIALSWSATPIGSHNARIQLSFSVETEPTPQRLTSAQLLKKGQLRSCYLDMFWLCAHAVRGQTSFQQKRLIIRMTDGQALGELFGSHPNRVILSYGDSPQNRLVTVDTVDVRYR